jgi:hypothetical protein
MWDDGPLTACSLVDFAIETYYYTGRVLRRKAFRSREVMVIEL